MRLPVLSDRATRCGTVVLLLLALLCCAAVYTLGHHVLAWLVPVPALVGAGCGELGIRLSRRAACRDRVLAAFDGEPGWLTLLELAGRTGLTSMDLTRTLDRLHRRGALWLRLAPAADPERAGKPEYALGRRDGEPL